MKYFNILSKIKCIYNLKHFQIDLYIIFDLGITENMSEDFQTRVALEETIRAKSEMLFKLKNSIISMHYFSNIYLFYFIKSNVWFISFTPLSNGGRSKAQTYLNC